MLRKYETVLIVKPDLSEEDFNVVKTRAVTAITNGGGHEIAFQDWGKKRLAYPIKKLPKGNYLYFRYLSDGDAVATLERNIRVLDSVLRYMTVKLDDRIDPESFDFDAERETIHPFGVKPRESSDDRDDSRDDDDGDDKQLDRDEKKAEVKAAEPKAEAKAEEPKAETKAEETAEEPKAE